ncbi:MAG: NAD-dependent DNA ligase LigA [Chitinophagaceae bacterium]
MYSTDQIKSLQQSSKALLKKGNQQKVTDIDLIRDVLRFHEYRYYVMDEPLIADVEYDQLFKILEKLETEYPERITTDSPTQRVAKGLTKDFPTVSHLVPMLSLQNSYNAADLLDWDRKCRELSQVAELEYCSEPKFDGASISVIYEDDLLIRAATRGNGVEGDEITTNIRQIRSVPLSAKFSDYGIYQVEIRGEVLMNKNSFKKQNEQLAALNLAPFANPRNAASGSLRIKDPNEVKRRNLEAFFYHVSYYTTTDGKKMSVDGKPATKNLKSSSVNPALATHSGTLQMLWDLGFRSPKKEMKVLKGIDAIIKHAPEFEEQRDEMPYEIDGMVIKVNDILLQEKLGMTTHHPRWAIAYKFKARQASSVLRKVEFQVGRTGSITPVGKIDPVAVGGVTVSSVSLFNEDVVKEKDLMIGDTVLVERAGDVIPYIVKSMTELRTGKEKEIVFPVNCPVCGDALFKPEGEAVWRCINVNCKAQVVERIIHFVSKDAMDIRSLGEANVRKFYELGILKDIPSIYTIDFDRFKNLEGFGQKSITNLQTAIEESKSQPLHRLIFGLGIRYVGENTAKTLSNVVIHLLDFKNYSLEQLQELEDVGVKVATSIYQFFSNNDNLRVLNKLEQLGVSLTNQKKKTVTATNLSGLSFLFTGTLAQLKRSEAEEMVEQKGGSLLGSVSSKLNFLVVGEDAGSKFEKAKKIQSIRIINEQEFLDLINGKEDFR